MTHTLQTIVLIGVLVTSAQAYQNPYIRGFEFTRLSKPLREPLLRFPVASIRLKHSSMPSTDADAITSSENTPRATKVLYALGASTSIAVSMTFFAVLAWKRDAFMVSFFIGSITNGALSKVLKQVLNQDRPETVEAAIEQPGDKGMPSSHAMSLGFIGVFTMLSLEWTRLVIPVYVAISLYYRVKTRLHTADQVMVGLCVGSLNGFIFRHLVDGTNPFGIHVMDFVAANFLNEQGLLPLPMLGVPLLAGAVIVGSLERKISNFLKRAKTA